MATTVPYEGFEQEEFNQEVELSRAEHPYGPKASARLAPVHVPNDVEFLVMPNGNAEIRFSYPNEEHVEKHRRRFLEDPRIAVRLGRHTGKILEIFVDQAEQQLRSGRIAFDSRECLRWVNEFPQPRRFVVERNAEIAQAILTTMPQKVRAAILEAFDRAKAAARTDPAR